MTRKFFLLIVFTMLTALFADSINAKSRTVSNRRVLGAVNTTAKATQAKVVEQGEATRQTVNQSDSNLSGQLVAARQEATQYQQQLAQELAVKEASDRRFQTFVRSAIYFAGAIALVLFFVSTAGFLYYVKFGKLPAFYIKGFTQETATAGYKVHKVLSDGRKIGYVSREERHCDRTPCGYIVIYPPQRVYGFFVLPGRVERVAENGLVPDPTSKGAWVADYHGWRFSTHRYLEAA